MKNINVGTLDKSAFDESKRLNKVSYLSVIKCMHGHVNMQRYTKSKICVICQDESGFKYRATAKAREEGKDNFNEILNNIFKVNKGLG